MIGDDYKVAKQTSNEDSKGDTHKNRVRCNTDSRYMCMQRVAYGTMCMNCVAYGDILKQTVHLEQLEAAKNNHLEYQIWVISITALNDLDDL